jgi:hypothetical protein
MRYLFFALALIGGISAVAPPTATAQNQQAQGQRCHHYQQNGNDDSSLNEDACP